MKDLQGGIDKGNNLLQVVKERVNVSNFGRLNLRVSIGDGVSA